MATGPNPPQPTRLERHAKVIGRSFMTRLRNYFLAGVLITAPITITVTDYRVLRLDGAQDYSGRL